MSEELMWFAHFLEQMIYLSNGLEFNEIIQLKLKFEIK